MPGSSNSTGPRALSYSTCIAEAVAGPPHRGIVHSTFKAAANIVFPDDFVLSLNAAISPRMPNGIQLATLSDTMPFSQLRTGMPVLLGVQRLCIQPLDYVLDLSNVPQWHPHIEPPTTLDMPLVQKNCAWLEYYVLERDGQPQRSCPSIKERAPFMEGENGQPQGQCPSIKELAPFMEGENGQPQGSCPSNKELARFIEGEDGRPQGSCPSNKGLARFIEGEDGRPQEPYPSIKEHAPFMEGEDGRPQGAPPHNYTDPVPTIYEQERHQSIVGTGVGWMRGGAPCGRPSSSCDPWYLSDMAPCGRPSSYVVEMDAPYYFIDTDNKPCGRPSSHVVEMDAPYYFIDTNNKPCGRPSSSCDPSYLSRTAPGGRPSSHVVEMARSLCGRGKGLTPSGDDMLVGWMAMGWLLNGPEADFLASCQQIVAIARQQTHLLSQCWLDYAAKGYVAEPIGLLLHALTQDDDVQLAQSAQAVLAMGATSGYDAIQGMLMAVSGRYCDLHNASRML